MSQSISVRVDSKLAQAAFAKAPEVITSRLDAALARGAGEIAGEAKRLAPKSLSNLVNSIVFGKLGELAYEVKAGSEHAAYVEGGTGPAAGQPKYRPNLDNLLMYLMTSPKARGFERWSRSDKGRLTQEMQLIRRAQAFSWWIYQHGTRAQPFMGPAVAFKRSAVEIYARQAVDRGINEIFGPGTVSYL